MKMRRDAGLTLLELAAVMAIFSLVAVLALQALSGAIATREKVAASGADTAALAAATALLRRDLRAMVPVPIEDRGIAFSDSANEIAFVAAGQFDLPDGARSGPAQVTWSIDANGSLLRTRQIPGDVPVTIEMLASVTGWDVRTLDNEGVWREETSADPAEARVLPKAIDVRFAAKGFDLIRVLVAR